MTPKRIITVVVLLAVAALVVVSLSRDAPYEIVNAQPRGENIIAFGDSLTAGNGASGGETYPEQLSRLIDRPILNKGVSGQTTKEAIERFERDVLEQDARILLLLLGGNDFMRKQNQDQAFERLAMMVSQAQQEGTLVVLIGLDFPLASTWHKRYENLARETGCVFVPSVLSGIFGHRDLMADSIHPNSKGYGIMAQRIEAAIRPYLN